MDRWSVLLSVSCVERTSLAAHFVAEHELVFQLFFQEVGQRWCSEVKLALNNRQELCLKVLVIEKASRARLGNILDEVLSQRIDLYKEPIPPVFEHLCLLAQSKVWVLDVLVAAGVSLKWSTTSAQSAAAFIRMPAFSG